MSSIGPDDMAAPPDSGYFAAEYVLGVLDAEQRREVEARIARDRRFAAEVAAWQTHLAPLADDIEPVAPPMHILPRLRSALFAPEPRASIWESLGFWRWLSGGAGALAVAALAALFVLSPSRTPAPTPVAPMMAAINLDDGKPAFLATIDAEHGRLLLLPVAASIPTGRVPELWLIPPNDLPHSLGVVDASRPMSIAIPPALRGAVGLQTTVAISIEPPGGSPTGQPTGPVIAKGGISSI